MSLPREILDAIFHHFGQKSTACGQEYVVAFDLPVAEYCANRRTLAALCRVDKHFRAIATPLLYAHVRLFNGDVRLFVCPILSNLQTRRLVNSLSLEINSSLGIDAELGDEEVPPMDEERYYYDHCLRGVLALVGKSDIAPGVGGSDILVAEGLETSGQFEEDLAAVLLFVLPELRHLQAKFDTYSDWADRTSAGFRRCRLFLQTLLLPFHAKHHWRNRTNIDMRPLTPASLFHLRELVIYNMFLEPVDSASSPPLAYGKIDDMQIRWRGQRSPPPDNVPQ
ncbi:hypothetical protein E8E14_013467 [Neopestalotiopsis sp. 37M]|nr:hypothetical protein E8E14_013467 [Neopestalotiopsis sp. 37M]